MGITVANWEHIRRFKSNYVEGELDQCWIWQGPPSRGYGRIRIGTKCFGAHVFAWELANGRDVTSGMHVMHSCNNKMCVNPNHLSEGTKSENVIDAWRDGLITVPSGEDHYNSIKTHCPEGHPYEGYNLVYKKGRRCCRECGNRQYREYCARKRTAGVS